MGRPEKPIDPSAEMLAQRAGGPAYLRAPAGRLPLAASSVDLVFTSMTLHHLDLRSAVCELSRVLRSPGTVLIRSPLSDYLRSPFYEFFPEARAADQVRTPSRKQVETAMAGHGLRLRSFELVTQTVARNLRHYLERMQARPYSSFAQLAEDEFSQGLARLERAAGRTPSAPVEDPVPFLCFGR